MRNKMNSRVFHNNKCRNISIYKATVAAISASVFSLASFSIAVAEPIVDANAPIRANADDHISVIPDIITSRTQDYGAFAKDGGTITLNGGSIVTSGVQGFGILVGESSSISSSANVTTSGARAHGVQAGVSLNPAQPTGTITLDGGKITTSGNEASGLHVYAGGTIEGTATIVTGGTKSFGAFAESDSRIELNGASISTTGSRGYGLLANNDEGTVGGHIEATGVSVDTKADWAFGAFAEKGGTINLADGKITTAGERAFGVLAGEGSTIITSADITTTGAKAHGVQTSVDGNLANQGGVVLLEGGTITTGGSDAFGLHSLGNGLIKGTANIITTGTNGYGAFAESYSSIALDGAIIRTSGASGFGLLVNNDDLKNNSNSIGGKITAENVGVIVSGTGTEAVRIEKGGEISISNSRLESVNAAGIALLDNAAVNLVGTTIVSAKETFASTLAQTGQVQNINVGAGTVATENNGILLNVNRTNDGGDGIVNLKLQAGSTASGDIIDTDAKTTGVTHVTVEKNATYNGKIEGIKDLNAESGTVLNFSDGTTLTGTLIGTNSILEFGLGGATIGGTVGLTGGSVTHGGGVFAPITVGGNVFFDQTSTMGGNWLIAGDLSAYGTIRPGNSIGIVTVGGDATFGADSVYEVEVAGDGTSDRINVTGKAILEGGEVHVYALDNKISYKDGQNYTILTAEDGIDGEFSKAVSKSIFLTSELDHQANQVDLKVGVVADAVDPTAPFETVALTSNQKSTAHTLDGLEQSGSSLELYNSVLFLTSEGEARGAFEQLSGDTHASAKAGLIETAHLTADAINNRLRSAFDGVGAPNTPVLENANDSHQVAFWGTGFGSWTDHDGNNNAGGLSSSTGGFLTGADIGLASGWRVGMAGGYSHSKFDAEGRYATTKTDNWHVGLYGGNQWGPVGLRTGLAYTWHSADSSRSIAYSGFSDSLSAEYDAQTFQAFGELSYRIDTASVAFEPFANLSYVNLHTDGFTERGGAAALAVNGGTVDSTSTTLGMRASAPVQMGSTNASLNGMIGWRHAYGDIAHSSTQAFAGSNAFSVEGIPIARDAALLEAGFNVAINEMTTLGINYVGQFGNGTTQNGFNAALNVKF